MVSRRYARIADHHPGGSHPRAVLCVRDGGGGGSDGSGSNGDSPFVVATSRPIYASRELSASARACRTSAMCRSDHAIVRARGARQ
ncbi:hypothetical protein PUN28_014108 [Cardiocondyla obscurior]|uniref:Uncharacterized protein n=1 Tax=Cardiocondyla obscurior TaxID=286306 RepID=A0AAW2F1X4_9HYME